MLNKDLLSENELKIVKLSMTIDAFKKYDAERKEYIALLERQNQNLQYQLDDIQSELKELYDAADLTDKLKRKFKAQKQELKALHTKMQVESIILTEEDLQKIHDIKVLNDIKSIKEQNIKLKKDNIRLQKTISDLIAKTIKN